MLMSNLKFLFRQSRQRKVMIISLTVLFKFNCFITFYRHNSNGRNHTITRDIFREDNRSTWKINGKGTTMKEVQELTKKLNVQIANLCQFLPQVWRSLQLCRNQILMSVQNILLQVTVGISLSYNAYRYSYTYFTDRQTCRDRQTVSLSDLLTDYCQVIDWLTE